MKHVSERHAGFEFEFKRTNVILGANGSGKSKLLEEIKLAAAAQGSKVVYIEGGRAIKLQDVLKLNAANVNQFDRLDLAIRQYEKKRPTSLSDRIFDALMVLDKLGTQMKATHSDDVAHWMDGGQSGECPKRGQPPLERLFELFNEIFPQITLSYADANRRLYAQKGGQTYGPSNLSDGEKQVFSILADFMEFDDSHKLVVADEPELNLHPELAERLWTLIEGEFPDKTFVYATHSINFALRASVEKVYVLSTESANIAQFAGLDSLPREEATAFLGALPGILSANHVLVTEGHEKSFDAIFYRWLLDDGKLEIYPCGGCADVVSVVKRSGLWKQISTSVDLSGVVDCDFRSDATLSEMAAMGVSSLKFHEAESYLCEPEVLCAVAGRIGSQETSLTVEAVENELVEMLVRQKYQIATRRVLASAHMALAVGLDRKTIGALATREDFIARLRESAAFELNKATVAIGPDEIESRFSIEVVEIDKIIAARQVPKILRYLPGKQVLQQLAPRAGCKNGADLMRSLRRNFKPADFASTAALAETIKSRSGA